MKETKSKRHVAIVHFNTPELTEATILSLRKHGGADYEVTVFDNSTERPFIAKMKGVTVVDNTQGQVIDFAKELAKFPNKVGTANDYGSVKHMMSVQKLWDILPDGFLLLDSDVLIKASVEHMFRDDFVAVGHVQMPQPGNKFNLSRLVPMVCYINVPMCKQRGLSYFDPERCWMVHSSDPNDRNNWYDTGASFYEDIHNHKNGAHGLRVDIRPLMEHYKRGSWARTNVNSHQQWLAKHHGLWYPTPQMQGNKKVAMCAIGRNENRYAAEWVEHYKKLGVSKIFVYDNYFGDETPLAVTLKDYVDSGFVEITDVHDRKNLQCRCYEHCYRKHGNEYAWIGFLDFDEFLSWKGKKKIETIFAQYQTGDVVLINWRLMTDSGLVHYDPRPVRERFTEVMPLDTCVKYNFPENDHVKSFVRGGLEDVKFGYNPHNPTGLRAVNAKGESVPCKCYIHPYNHDVMWIDHYWTKTADEWVNNKLPRGFASGQTYIDRFRQAQARYFFAANERTPEKEAIIYGKPVAAK